MYRTSFCSQWHISFFLFVDNSECSCRGGKKISTIENANIINNDGTDSGNDFHHANGVKNSSKHHYISKLNSWSKDSKIFNVILSENTKPQEETDVDKVLGEGFVEETPLVLLKDNTISPFYHYILRQWTEGNKLERYLLIYFNVSKHNDVLAALNDQIEPKLRQESLDALKNVYILVLIDGFTEGKEFNFEMFEEQIKNLTKISIWTTKAYGSKKEFSSVVQVKYKIQMFLIK